jgi:hypothetical protein
MVARRGAANATAWSSAANEQPLKSTGTKIVRTSNMGGLLSAAGEATPL